MAILHFRQAELDSGNPLSSYLKMMARRWERKT